MKITVKLFASLRNHGENESVLEVAEATRPLDIIDQLKLPKEEVAIIMVNGRSQNEDVILKEGDVLSIFPAVGGG